MLKKLITSIAVSVGMVLGVMAMPAQAAPLDTNPSASPSTFNPVVVDGFRDTTTISWTGIGSAGVFIHETTYGDLVGHRLDLIDNSFAWDGSGGPNLTGDVLSPGVYNVCVIPEALEVDPYSYQDPAFCTLVTIQHVYNEFTITHTKRGTNFYRTVGTCPIHRIDRAGVLGVSCDSEQQRALIYRLGLPTLGFGQHIVGSWCSAIRVVFVGNGAFDLTDLPGHFGRCVVGIDGHFNGRIWSVTKHFEIVTNY